MRVHGDTITAEPLGSELASPDLHPLFVKGNSPEGVSISDEDAPNIFLEFDEFFCDSIDLPTCGALNSEPNTFSRI